MSLYTIMHYQFMQTQEVLSENPPRFPGTHTKTHTQTTMLTLSVTATFFASKQLARFTIKCPVVYQLFGKSEEVVETRYRNTKGDYKTIPCFSN